MTQIADEQELRTHYREPSVGVLQKSVDHIDAGAAGFLAATTLAVVATTGPEGADASPRGGPAGFLRVVDEHRIAFGDLAGNNRLDTYANLTTHPEVGLLCIVPGLEETLRINGRASLTTEPAVLEATAIDGRVPKVAVVIEVRECFIHCAKALRRSGIWDASTWPAAQDRPAPVEILLGHLGLEEIPVDAVAADLEKNYQETIWDAGEADREAEVASAVVGASPIDLLQPGRKITGMSAILLPHLADGTIDWAAFEAHVTRTATAGLTPAVNMDTGFVHLLTPTQRLEVLGRTRALGVEFVAGAFDLADVETVQAHGGTPVLFPSAFTIDVLPAYERVATVADRFYGFELSPVFHPDGRIWDLDTYRAVLGIGACIGAKHSSLDRGAEWDRLRVRDAERPEFLVLTGNDLAIDMVMYGSDYLLGLSTFAPDAFAERDACWANGDLAGFHRLNDALQWLGTTAFRPPVPAYRHDAALFLQLRGWATSDVLPAGAPRRQAWEIDLLRDIAQSMGLLR